MNCFVLSQSLVIHVGWLLGKVIGPAPWAPGFCLLGFIWVKPF